MIFIPIIVKNAPSMKLVIILFVSCLALLQPRPAEPLEHTMALFRQDNHTELYKSLAPSVDVSILSDQNTYTKTKAQEVLNAFFAKNAPTGARFIHKIDSKPEIQYGVILLLTRGGDFRISFTLKNNKGVYQLTELSIDEEKPNML